MSVDDFFDDDPRDHRPVEAPIRTTGNRIFAYYENQTHRMDKVQADLLVAVPLELVCPSLRKRPDVLKHGGSFEFLKPGCDPAGHRGPESPDHRAPV